MQQKDFFNHSLFPIPYSLFPIPHSQKAVGFWFSSKLRCTLFVSDRDTEEFQHLATLRGFKAFL